MKKIALFLLLTLLSFQFTAQDKEGTKQSKYSQDLEKKYELKFIKWQITNHPLNLDLSVVINSC